MNLIQKYGKTALIAGASEGIGAAFASCLAERGLDLVLIARRPKPLQQVASALEKKYNVNVKCITCDLSGSDASRYVLNAVNGNEISFLVYNAASSYIGPFIKNSPENYLQMAGTNMLTPLKMIHMFGKMMVERRKGAIILMTSLAGFQGSGNLSVYASTKAFIRVLGESLWYEWKNSGVDVLACCAGATATPGYINTYPEKSGIFAPRVLTPEEVTLECMKNLGKRPSFIAGRGNRLASFFMQKVFPLKMAVTIMGDTTRKMYRL